LPKPGADAARHAGAGTTLPRSIAPATGSANALRMLTPVETTATTPLRYSVTLDGLALRTVPDLNGDVITHLIAGDTVTALAPAARAGWTAVRFGQGDGAKRGWAATQWLLPLMDP
jgi:hypothetical protein